jgi:hypothetical protein
VDILDKKTFRSTNLSFVLSKILISIETSSFFFAIGFTFNFKLLINNNEKVVIKKNMGWCDDPSSKNYKLLLK